MKKNIQFIVKNLRDDNDQVIRKPGQKKTFKSGGRGGNKLRDSTSQKSVVVRVRRERDSSPPVRESSTSIFDRLGTVDDQKDVSGTKIIISGLTSAVTTTDITQLCESIGEVKNVLKNAESAEVVFAKRSDAMSAIKKFHGLTLDGVPMKVSLAGNRGKPNPFDPNVTATDDVRGNRKGNVREGFFGTKGGNNGVDINYGYKKKSNPADFGGNRKGNVREGFFGTRGSDNSEINYGYKKKSNSSQGITVTVSNNNRNGGGFRGGRGQGRGGKGGQGRGGKGSGRNRDRRSEPAKSAEDLDKEMDEYFAK